MEFLTMKSAGKLENVSWNIGSKKIRMRLQKYFSIVAGLSQAAYW